MISAPTDIFVFVPTCLSADPAQLLLLKQPMHNPQSAARLSCKEMEVLKTQSTAVLSKTTTRKFLLSYLGATLLKNRV